MRCLLRVICRQALESGHGLQARGCRMKRALVGFLALFAAGVLADASPPAALSPVVAPVVAQAEPRELVVIEGADYFGHDYETLQEVSLADCEAACRADGRCRAFTFNRNAGWCFLKSSFGELRAFDGAVSGYLKTGPVGAADRRLARRSELAFLPSGYREEADDLARRIAEATEPAGTAASLEAIVADARAALAENNPLEAARAYQVALRLAPHDAGLWLALAKASVAVRTNDWSLRQRVQQEATGAAVNAYLNAGATSERAQALALIGRSLEARSAWRPAIRAARASLALVDNPGLQAHLGALVAQHGFRVLNHSVSSDARDPRICVQFSEPLARDDVSIADYILLDRPDLAIEPEAEQVCIDGVRHGERYRIEVRAGLPANDGERLAKPVVLEVYVRDRSPSARFPGRAFVLVRGDGAALPVVTLNTGRLDAALYRVGELALGGFAADQELLKQLNDDQIEAIRERRGELLWKGQIETRRELNQEVTTAVPVAELIAGLGPEPERAGPGASRAASTPSAPIATRSTIPSPASSSGEAAEPSESAAGLKNAKPAVRATTTAIGAPARLDHSPGPSAAGLAPGAYILRVRPADAIDRVDWVTQWFVVSDLGLTALSTDDGLHAFVRGLTDAEPLADVGLRLMALNQSVLGEARADALGHAQFPAGLLRGEGGNRPALLVAEDANGDFGILDLQATPFDLSDRGVTGRPAPGPIDSYLVTERGIYRPGETLVLTALTRDPSADALSALPLTFVIERPDGVEQRREQVADQGLGGHQLRVPLLADAMRGTWQAKVYADPAAEPLAQTAFLVEDFEPERLDFELQASGTILDPAAPPTLEVAARYLYGAPAAGLEVEGRTRVTAAEGLIDWPGWRFGLADETPEDRSAPLPGAETDAQGRVRLGVELPTVAPSSRPLQAQISVQVIDGSGRPVERDLSLPMADPRPRIGLKPLFDGAVEQGGNARFQVMVLGADGAPLAASGLRWRMAQKQTSYQWYQTDGDWRYEPIVSRTRVASGVLDVTADRGAPTVIEVPVDWGAYELVLDAPEDGAKQRLVPASVDFEAGWYVAPKAFDTPDVLKVSLDRAEYRVGDRAKVRLEPRFPGLALVLVIGSDGLVDMHPVAVPEAGATLELPVRADWGPGAYVTAMLYRGMDLAARRMPRRAIGLHWAGVDPEQRRLAVELEAPAQQRPRGALDVTVRVSNLAPGEEAYVTLAAVDLGILNLTRFAPWSPGGWYFGQRRLGAEVRDLYGQLIDRMQGEPGRLRTGSGARQLMSFEGPPPSEALVAFQSEILRVDANGEARLSVDLPDFNGQVQLMAMAWSARGVGQALGQVRVRDPIVATAAMPRFLAPGDQSRILIELAHLEGPAGEVEVSLSSKGEGLRIENAGQPVHLELADQGRARVRFPVEALAPGDNALLLRLVTPAGEALTKTLMLGVRRLDPPVMLSRALALPPDGVPIVLGAALGASDGRAAAMAQGLADGLAGDFLPGSGHWWLSVSGIGALDVPGLLWALDRYPYDCAEQLSSRALPLLYLDRIAQMIGLPDDAEAPARVRDAISRLLAYQGATGGFGLWGPMPGELWLDAYVTDVLTRAREQGYAVPGLAFRNALDNLRNRMSYAADFQQGGEGIAYALYVLARNGRVPVGDLRYYLETKLEAFATPMARAQLGAALALYAESGRAATALRSALALWRQQPADAAEGWRADFGSHLRDGAALLALAAEADRDAIDLQALTNEVVEAWNRAELHSTQEQAWMLMAATALMDGAARPRLSINGQTFDGALYRGYSPAQLEALAGLQIANLGDRPLTAMVTAMGIPRDPPPASSNGYQIERSYYDLEGRAVAPERVTQGERLVALLTITADRSLAARLLINDPLPAGLEIESPHLLRSGSVDGLPWLGAMTETAHVAFGADRFVAAVDRGARDPRRFQLAYVLRAVSPGRFAQPAAMVEAMYQPALRGRTGAGRLEVRAPE